MKSVLPSVLLVATLAAVTTGNAYAEPVIEEFEIEGMVSPASPKALTAALEEKLDVKVAGYNFYNTDRGWPIIQVQFESGKTTRAQIEQVIAATSDPTGRKYKIHAGPPRIAADLLEEEIKAAATLGPGGPQVGTLKNPIPTSAESTQRGKGLYVQYCAKCHGLSGNGQGPSAHGIQTFPRELWVWHNADPTSDSYLFWFITNGRTDMPPWGVILSENERWDLINYIKTIEPPKKQ
jgi:mono/diheme cytochrome c family protein